jgi:hypothetical protein
MATHRAAAKTMVTCMFAGIGSSSMSLSGLAQKEGEVRQLEAYRHKSPRYNELPFSLGGRMTGLTKGSDRVEHV